MATTKAAAADTLSRTEIAVQDTLHSRLEKITKPNKALAALTASEALAALTGSDAGAAASKRLGAVERPPPPATKSLYCRVCRFKHVPGALVSTGDVRDSCFGCQGYAMYLKSNPIDIRPQGDDDYFYKCTSRGTICGHIYCYCNEKK